MMVTNGPTRRTHPKPAHAAAEFLAKSIVSRLLTITWDSASKEFKDSLIYQADMAITSLEIYGWLIVRKDGG